MVEEGRSYFILSLSPISSLALTSDDENNVLGSTFRGEANQKWISTQREEGIWMLRNVASGKFLSIAGWPRPSANVIVTDFPTLWEINPGPGGPDFLSILIPDSRLNVSLPNGGRLPPIGNFPVTLQDDPIQSWRFTEAEE